MTNLSTYQPFLIGEGNTRSGLFQYLESWVKPQDAFDVLENCYVYRGCIWKREGMAKYPSSAGAGSLVYANSSQVGAIAAGGVTSYTNASGGYSDIPIRPIIVNTVKIYARTSAGVETWTDNGAGVLTGSLGDTGAVAYTTGVWSLTLGGGRTFNNPTQIWATYGFAVKTVTAGGPFHNPIMGIKQFVNEQTNAQVLVVMDTKRASYHDGNSFRPLNTVSQTVARGGAAQNPVTFTLPFTPVTPFTVTITSGVDTVTDLGNGTFTAAGNITGGTINYATGAVSLTLTAPNTNLYTASFTINGDYFTGDNTNFFNTTNWKPRDTAPALMYMTNNVDRITTFDGTNLARPPFCITSPAFLTLTNEVNKTLDVKVFKNSLIFIRPTVLGSASPEAQMIRSSIPSTSERFSIHNFVSDITGNGNAQQAPTGDWIMSAQFLRDSIVVFFLNGVWLFRFTGSSFDPFRFTQINAFKSTNAPYGSIAYDTYCTSMGNKGLIMCDGVEVERYDIDIIDQFLEIESLAFKQCYGLRYDSLQQSWMLYPGEGDAKDGATQLTSSRILVYNFLEKTWAIYYPTLGNTEADANVLNTLSCVGLGYSLTDVKWSDFAPGTNLPQSGKKWSEWSVSWGSDIDVANQPVVLGGDQNGWVYQMNTTDTDDGNKINPTVLTKRMNPFLPAEKACYGYVDVYYEKAPTVTLIFSFYFNNSKNPSVVKEVALTGSQSSDYAWKRIYLNGVTGQFIQIGITDKSAVPGNEGASWKILGMIVHASPAGRLTPGSFL